MTLVLDASMTMTWFFADEMKDASRAILNRVSAEGAIVPAHWHLEVANAFRTAVRKRRCDEDHVDQSLARLARLPIDTDDETERHAWTATRDLSRSKHLTPYDAAYLELAMRTGFSLASCDGDLLAAAASISVETHTA